MQISTPMKRLVAVLVDGIATWIITVIALILVGLPLAFSPAIENVDEITLGLATGAYGIYALILIGSTAIIQFYFWTKGTSIGKAILKMKVVRKETQEPLGFWGMAVREIILKQVSALFFGLGFIWILVDSQTHQGWHDKILGTLVIDNK